MCILSNITMPCMYGLIYDDKVIRATSSGLLWSGSQTCVNDMKAFPGELLQRVRRIGQVGILLCIYLVVLNNKWTRADGPRVGSNSKINLSYAYLYVGKLRRSAKVNPKGVSQGDTPSDPSFRNSALYLPVS